MKGTGGASTKFTLLGYVQAGCPKELQLFKPGSDPESDEPELTVGFKLSAPVTEVKLGGLPLEELLGTYSATFTSEGETATYNFTFMYYEGQLVFMPEGKDFGTALLILPGPYEYDPSTATATCEAPGESLSLSTHVRFISEEGTASKKRPTRCAAKTKKRRSSKKKRRTQYAVHCVVRPARNTDRGGGALRLAGIYGRRRG